MDYGWRRASDYTATRKHAALVNRQNLSVLAVWSHRLVLPSAGSVFRRFFLSHSSSGLCLSALCRLSTFRLVRYVDGMCARRSTGSHSTVFPRSHRHHQPIGSRYYNAILYAAVARAEPGTGGHGIGQVITGSGVRVRRHTERCAGRGGGTDPHSSPDPAVRQSSRSLV